MAWGHQQLRCSILLLGVHTCASSPVGFSPGHGSTCSVAFQAERYCLLPSTRDGQGAGGLVLQLPGPGWRGVFSQLLDNEFQLPTVGTSLKTHFVLAALCSVSLTHSHAVASWDDCQITTSTRIPVSVSVFGGT